MKINISKIPERGLDISEVYDPRKLDLETEEIKFQAPLKASAKAVKDNDDIRIDGIVNGKLTLVCSRCLMEYELDMSRDFRFIYQVNPVRKPSSSLLSRSGLSNGVKRGEVLDITNDIREEIILEYPMKPLCREDCRGLCPVCGQNLNEGECGCGTSQKTPF